MESQGFIIGGLYRTCEWLMRLAYLNLLWALFSLLGLIVLGVFPATAAMCAVVHQWHDGKMDTPAFRMFWQAYRKYFMKANTLGCILVSIGIILYVDIRVFAQVEGWLGTVLLSSIFAFLLIYGIILLYTFPVLVRGNTTLYRTLKDALLIGVSSPLFTLFMVLCLIVLNAVFFYFPTLSIFFFGSAAAVVIMYSTNIIFQKIAKVQGEMTS